MLSNVVIILLGLFYLLAIFANLDFSIYSKQKKKVVIPAKAGIQAFELFRWIPTFVGMTSW